jgi:hypothetical protein
MPPTHLFHHPAAMDFHCLFRGAEFIAQFVWVCSPAISMAAASLSNIPRGSMHRDAFRAGEMFPPAPYRQSAERTKRAVQSAAGDRPRRTGFGQKIDRPAFHRFSAHRDVFSWSGEKNNRHHARVPDRPLEVRRPSTPGIPQRRGQDRPDPNEMGVQE